MNKSDNDKEDLIIRFFNNMVKGKILSFATLLFGVCILICSVQEDNNLACIIIISVFINDKVFSTKFFVC